VKGVSLVESVIGASILALAAAVILSLLPSSFLSVRRSERQLQAGALAQSWLEQQKLVYFPDLQSVAALPTKTLEDGVVLRPALSVTGAGSGAKRVRVTVAWVERERNFSVFRETVLARLPR